MSIAQTHAGPHIALSCIGTENVAADTLTGLCADLQLALAAKHPDTRFVFAKAGPSDASGRITLEAFAAGKTGIEARLIWQAKGADRVDGPKMGFSITDAEMTPDMQLKFLNRLVLDSPLPLSHPAP